MWELVSGGFAVVQPDSRLSINAVEGYPLEDFSAEVSVDVRECHGRSIAHLYNHRLSVTKLPRPKRLPTATAVSKRLLRPRLNWRYVFLKFTFLEA